MYRLLTRLVAISMLRVENTPDDDLKGFDRELKTAVDEVLRMLKEEK